MSCDDDAQDAALRASGGVLVEAGPGTGKTFLIASKVARLVASGIDPKRILVMTFSRRAAAELTSRLAGTAGSEGCEVRTFHGFASRLLEAGGARFKTRRLLGGFAESLLFERAVAETPLATIDDETRRSRRFRDDARRFATDLRRSDPASASRLRETATPRLRDLVAIADAAAATRERLRASDLDDLIGRAVDALGDPASAASRWLDGRYAHLLVDEFQDIDRVQLTLCERIGGEVFAVGDPAQSIYRFRGAVHGIFADGARRLGLAPFTLRTSRRCPQIVLDLAARTPFLNATPLRSAAGRSGAIAVVAARTTLDEASAIADRIEDALADGVPAERIAVLVRTMRPLGDAVVRELGARLVPVATSGSDAFFGDPSIALVRLALRAIAAPHDHDRWTAFLSAPPLGYDVTALRIELARIRFATVDDAVGWLGLCALPGALDPERLCGAIRSAADALAEHRLGDAARGLVRGLAVVERLTKSADTGDARASIERVTRFLDALAEAHRALAVVGAPADPATVIDAIDEHLEAIGGDRTPPDEARGVRVLTIHGAKGLQFDLVVIGDAVDGRLPSPPRASTLLDGADRAELDASGVDCVDGRDDDGMIEEASLWYVAVTRARDVLVVTYAETGGDGAPQRISRFVPVDLHPPEGATPYERPRERFEARLAASAEPAARATLARLAERSPLAAAIRTHGTAAFARPPARPVVAPGPHSVSAAATWTTCPRRFFYANVLRLRTGATLATTRGSALHTVLARFHAEVREIGPGAAQPADAWSARLRALREEVWASADFGSETERAASAASADRRLARYAETLAREGAARPFTVVAVEEPIEIALGGGALRGRIDRVDRLTDGTLVLRDYKLGKRKKPPFAKALDKAFADGTPEPGEIDSAFNPQLALYRTGAERHFGARVTSIDFVFFHGSDDAPDGIESDATAVAGRGDLLDALDRFTAERFVDAFAAGSEVPMTSDAQACRYCPFGVRRLCEGVDA